MKIDIRILLFSLLFHFSFYGLLSLVTEPSISNTYENIEVVFEDNNEDKLSGFVPKLAPINQMEDNNKKATVLSDQRMRFQQETIAQNTGVAQNNLSSQESPKTQPEEKLEFDKLGFKPLEKNPNVNRTSAIHLNLPHIQDGSLTFLNADFSTYASFFNRIGPNIVSHWGSNVREFAYFPQVREQIVLKGKWSTRIEVVLDKKGYLKDVIIINSSGMRELDFAVVDAIKASAPFLNPPTGMVEEDGSVRIHGQFSVLTRNPRLAN